MTYLPLQSKLFSNFPPLDLANPAEIGHAVGLIL